MKKPYPNGSPIIKRFFAYVQLDLRRGCWLWIGALNKHNYGQFHDSTRNQPNIHAFRWAYEYFKGPLPEGYEPDHLCRIRPCVNPDHLEGVTQQVNASRASRKEVCLRGHNDWAKDGDRRKCRICRNEREKKRVWNQRRLNGAFIVGGSTCKRGHNNWASKTINGKLRRVCRTCRNATVQRYRQRREDFS